MIKTQFRIYRKHIRDDPDNAEKGLNTLSFNGWTLVNAEFSRNQHGILELCALFSKEVELKLPNFN